MSKKTFILGQYISGHLPPAPVKVAQRIFDELTKQKYDVTFIEYFYDGRKHSIFTKLFGYEIIFTNTSGKLLRLGIIRFALLLLRARPDIVHIITFERFPLIAFLLRPFLNYKIVYSIHGVSKYERNLNSIKPSKAYLLKENLSNFIYYYFSDTLLFLSEDSVKIARRYYKLKADKIKIIENGIDSCFNQSYIIGSRNNSNKNKAVFIGDIGRKEKGLEFLLEVLNGLDLSLELYIIGTGYNKDKISCGNKTINISIINKMEEPDLVEFYRDKNIFISTSLHDSFGIAAVEAMAAGLIPVVSANTGMSRHIKQGINGFTFKYGEKEELNKILTQILRDDKLQERLSQEAAKIYEKLSWEKVSEMYQEIYNLS